MHVAADLLDAADELVPDDHRHGDGLLRPGIPVVDVDVGAANRVLEHADEYVVDADLGNGDLLQPETLGGVLLDEGLHGIHRGKKGNKGKAT